MIGTFYLEWMEEGGRVECTEGDKEIKCRIALECKCEGGDGLNFSLHSNL